jgi:predicted ATPase
VKQIKEHGSSDIKGFYGREKELAWLRGLFEEVADVDHKTGKSKHWPKLAVIVAETGIGKSRLVQALYQQLTIDEKWESRFDYQ